MLSPTQPNDQALLASLVLSETKVHEANIPLNALNMVSNALIAEYNAMRDASLSRDHRVSSLENLIMIVFSATIVGLPTIISQQQFLVLPLLSLLLSALTVSYRRQGRLLRELANYENDVLRPKLQSLLRQASHPCNLPDGLDMLWQWQGYHTGWQRNSSLLQVIMRRVAPRGLRQLSLLISAGYLLLFIYYRGWANLLIPETALFLLALLYLAPIVFEIVYNFVLDIRSITRSRI
jgi:hypothetical protein